MQKKNKNAAGNNFYALQLQLTLPRLFLHPIQQELWAELALRLSWTEVQGKTGSILCF